LRTSNYEKNGSTLSALLKTEKRDEALVGQTIKNAPFRIGLIGATHA
jgi:hypothetical protein